jgi:predicted membrane channel-forming protein YqfA (hemolysin III family)
MADMEESATPNTFGLMKYVHIIFFVGGVALAWLLVNVVESVWTSLNLAVVAVPPPSGWKSIAIGTILSAGATFYLWRHPKVNRLAVEIVKGDLADSKGNLDVHGRRHRHLGDRRHHPWALRLLLGLGDGSHLSVRV